MDVERHNAAGDGKNMAILNIENSRCIFLRTKIKYAKKAGQCVKNKK